MESLDGRSKVLASPCDGKEREWLWVVPHLQHSLFSPPENPVQGMFQPEIDVKSSEQCCSRLFRSNSSSICVFCREPTAQKPRQHLHHVASDAICGAAGEVAALVAFYPLDTLKVNVQAKNICAAQALKEIFSLSPAAALRTLYAGMGNAAAGAVVVGSLYFLTFHGVKRAGAALQKNSSSTSTTSPLIATVAGVAASVVGSLIEAPIEAFKVRAQAGGSPSTFAGGAALYASFIPFLLKALPHDVTELFTFTQMSENSSVGAVLASVPAGVKDMMVGAAAAAAAAVASMPFDITFTHMHIGESVAASAVSAAGVSSSRNQLVNFFATAQTIVATGGGPQALFRGMLPRLLHTVPAGMVYWVVVEATRRALESKYNVERPEVSWGEVEKHSHQSFSPSSPFSERILAVEQQSGGDSSSSSSSSSSSLLAIDQFPTVFAAV